MKTQHVTELPTCSFCPTAAYVDAPTILGSWAYMCLEHEDQYMVEKTTIGTLFSTEPAPERNIAREIMLAIESGDFDLADDLVGDGDICEYL